MRSLQIPVGYINREEVEHPMKKSVRKAITRRLRRMVNHHIADLPNEKFEMGRLASQLFPDWIEGNYASFQDYLYHACGMPSNVARHLETMAHTYYEIPSLDIWMQVGWTRAAQAASENRDGQIRKLLESGSNVLDVLNLI
jgi:hypothetical protein